MSGIIRLAIVILLLSRAANAAPPVLFFSDLDSGPKTGWENGSTKGAAVTIWGENFGEASAAAKVTVAGQDITSTDLTFISEWNVDAGVRSLRRITFWLKPTSTDGAGTISVTTTAGTSNTVPFTVRTGTIYYIATNGSDSNRGRTTSAPWLTQSHSLAVLAAGDIVYFRGGTYAGANNDAVWNNFHGSAGNPVAFVGYPAETAVIGDYSKDFCWSPYNNGPNADVHDITVAKLNWQTQGCAVASSNIQGKPQYNFRVIGLNALCQNNIQIDAGVLYTGNSYNWKMYGNYISGCGAVTRDHTIYMNSCQDNGCTDIPHDIDLGWNELTNQQNGSNIKVHPKDTGTNVAIDNVWIHDNWIHDSDNEAIEMGARAGTIYIYNNLIYNTGKRGTYNGGLHLTYQTNSAVIYFYNNTLVNTASYGNESMNFTDSVGVTIYIRNNIFYETAPGHTLFADFNWGGTRTADYNQYFNLTKPSWDTGGHSITSDPKFVSASDFHLQAISSAKDAGFDSSAIVKSDFNGNKRPKAAAIDIGAFEYSVYSTLSPPKNLR